MIRLPVAAHLSVDPRASATPRRAPAALVPAVAARLGGLAVLAFVGALQWRRMIEGAGVGQALLWALVAVGAGAAVVAADHLRRQREAATLAAAAVALLAAVAASGLPLSLLDPEHWGRLADGLWRGTEALGGVWLPYAGVDPWPGFALRLLGALLCVLAGLLAFWPREGGRGYPFLALGGLLTLVATPVVSLGGTRPLLLGGVLAAGTVCFLWLERLPLRPGIGVAALFALALAGAVPLAGVADREDPWFDYRTFAEGLGPVDPVRFDWTQRYGPLDWPRTRAEVMRVKAAEPSYWKLRTLEDFDGVGWRDRVDITGRVAPELDLPYIWGSRPEWTQRFQVSLRRLESPELVGAGTVLGVTGSPQRLVSTGEPGMWRGAQPFGRGDSYRVRAYVPRPSPAELGASPSGRQADELNVRVPILGRGPVVREARVFFAPFEPRGAGRAPQATYPARGSRIRSGARALRSSAYARTWRLATRLRAEADTPYEYVTLVAAQLRDGFRYSERPVAPAPGQAPLEAFLFEGRRGYCQHFAGAMALLLRMGGVPARVAAGFSPGGFSERKDAWVVRDTDAHAWVEAWFDRFGWVALDPTPPATPARSLIASLAPSGPQPAESAGTEGVTGDGPSIDPRGGRFGARPGGAASPATAGGGDAGGGGAWWPLAVLAAALAGASASVLWRARRPEGGEDGGGRLDRAVAELEAALRRTGSPVAPGMTLRQLEQRLGGTPEVTGYLRALRSGRYGPATALPSLPTAAQRRALRRALAAGGGPAAWLRALWALPPWRR